MIFGNASWGFRETPLEKQLEITSNMNLELLELGIANADNDVPLDVTDEQIEHIKKLYEKYNIKLLCAATGNDFTEGNADDVIKIKTVTDICKKLGIKYLRIFAGFFPAEYVKGQRWDIMINSLNSVYEYAVETHGGVNCFEDGVEHFYSTSSKPEMLSKMISEVPKIRINFDPANLYAVGIKNPESVYELIKDKVSCAHLKDFSTVDSGHLVPSACGESDMDWSALMKVLSDFEGPALFEYEKTEDIADGCSRSYDYIKKFI